MSSQRGRGLAHMLARKCWVKDGKSPFPCAAGLRAAKRSAIRMVFFDETDPLPQFWGSLQLKSHYSKSGSSVISLACLLSLKVIGWLHAGHDGNFDPFKITSSFGTGCLGCSRRYIPERFAVSP